MRLEVSEKHIGLRIALTAVAFVIAVVAFTYGVTRIGHKDPGYHVIEAKVDAETILVNKAVTFKYWFDGKSNAIKEGINDLTAAYTPILSAAYKELDHQNTYTGAVNIASLNQNQGQELTVSQNLYSVLKDAYGRTLEQKGYNMFAGALYTEWRSILILDEPSDFDPDNNPDEAARISAIASMVSDLSNFSLEFSDASRTVRFSVSDKYAQFCRDLEIDAPALDLNLLKDAYMLKMISEGLGLREDGYLYTAEGTVLNMRQTGTLGYDMYTLEDGKETVYASVNLEGAFSATTFTAFGMGSYYGYKLMTINDNNGSNGVNGNNSPLYRHMYFDVRTGEFTNILMSATVISRDKDIVEDVYQTIILNTLSSEKEVSSYAASLEKAGMFVSYVFQSAGT